MGALRKEIGWNRTLIADRKRTADQPARSHHEELYDGRTAEVRAISCSPEPDQQLFLPAALACSVVSCNEG